MKKLLSVLLTIILLVSVVPLGAFSITASATTVYTQGYYDYFVSNGEATINDVNDSISGNVTIPSTLGGYPVTRIGMNAFYNCDSITCITISKGITTIGKNAFKSCDRLTTVNYEAINCTSMYTESSYYTSVFVDSPITTVNIGDSVEIIPVFAFHECEKITSVTIGKGVKTISGYAFFGCIKLTSITVPNNVTNIGNCAFYNCSALTSVTISDSVTNISSSAFSCCDNLAEINVDNNNSNYCSQDGVLFNKDKTSLIQYPANKADVSYVIPESVIVIEEDAFRECNNLVSVTISDNVTSIGGFAFSFCDRLTIVNYNAKKCETMHSQELQHSTISYIYYSVFRYSPVTTVNIGSNVESIPSNAFSCCDNLTTVNYNATQISYIPSTVYRNSPITTVNIGTNVKTIPAYAFYNCNSVTSITIPDSVTRIGIEAFGNCNSLTNIEVSHNNPNYCSIDGVLFNKDKTSLIQYPASKADVSYVIPESVIVIEADAFRACNNLVSVTISDNVTNIGNSAFYNCTSLRNITIPDSVTSIGGGAFRGCTGLTSTTIPDSVTSIDGSVFYNCTGLTRITIPDGVTSIGDYAFYNCTSLTSVTIGDGVTSIGDYAFGACTSIKKVYITDIATWCNIEFFNIDSNPLYYAKNFYISNKLITNLVIPDGVTSISEHAFYNCNSITSVTIPQSVKTINRYAFGDCGNFSVFYTGAESEKSGIAINSYAFSGSNITWCYETCIGSQTHTYDDYCYDTECNVCGKIRTVPHNYEWKIDINPTCIKTGIKHEECTGCHIKRNENTIIDATGIHYFQWITDKQGNCGYDGLKHEECTMCNLKRNENTIIKATGEHITDDLDDNECNICRKNKIRISFNLNNGSGNFEQLICYFNETIQLPSGIPIRTGYKFMGWSKTLDGDVEFQPGDIYQENYSLTLYAVWHLYCTTCNGNGHVIKECTECDGDGEKWGEVGVCDTCFGLPYRCLDCGKKFKYDGIMTSRCPQCKGGNIRSCDDCWFSLGASGKKYEEVDCDKCFDGKFEDDCVKCDDGLYICSRSGHIYDNACDTTCNVCSEIRAITHTYDNACDADCNICGATRTPSAHRYDNTCDTTCNECGATRTITHTYSNNCDADCNICGETRTVPDHIYDDMYDADCNACGATREVPPREWQISVNTTGVYSIKPNQTISGFNANSITVYDKNGNEVKYNTTKKGYPLVASGNYTIVLNIEYANANTLNWNLTKKSETIFTDTKSNGWYNDAVTYAVGAGLINGYGGTTKFGTADNIQRQDFVVILARLAGVDLDNYASSGNYSFADVPSGAYYEKAILWAADCGITTGYAGGTKFGVGDKITREQLVTFLYRYAKYANGGIAPTVSADAEQSAKTYADYNGVNDYAKEAVIWALDKGVIKGQGGTHIAPSGNALRCEIAQIMYNIYLNDIF